jgi:dTDP-4-dehydrorhamnose 3,5-epimerase-like enzyme
MINNKTYTGFVDQEEFPSDPLVPLDPPFENAAGTIQNLLNCKIGAVAIIHSVKGSVRSNHWHKSNWHYLYVVSGSVKYYERNLDGTDVLIAEYKAGDMFFTPPNKVHKTEFLEDCVMMSFGRDSKEHDAHEEDVVREEF